MNARTRAAVICLWFVACSAILSSCAHKQAPAPGAPSAVATTAPTTRRAAPIISHGPYLQAPSPTSMTIAWATSEKCVSRVEYAQTPEGPWRTAISSHQGLVDADATFHSITLSNLQPGSTYHYRVISRAILEFQPYKVTYGETVAAGPYSFATLDPQKERFSFLVINDRHEKLPALRQALSTMPLGVADLVFLNGDMLDFARDEAQLFRAIVDPCVETFAREKPFAFVRGNHETRGAFARRFLPYFPSPSREYYYALAHGGVSFLVLDGGEDKADANPEYFGLVDFDSYLEKETQWLRAQVQSEQFRNAAFRVVLMHIPPFDEKSPKFIRGKYLLDQWGPLFNESKVDVVISGHTHHDVVLSPGDGRAYPVVISGVDTVVRADVAGDCMIITASGSNGVLKSRPLCIGRR